MKPEEIGELNTLRERFVQETEEFLDGIKERMARRSAGRRCCTGLSSATTYSGS